MKKVKVYILILCIGLCALVLSKSVLDQSLTNRHVIWGIFTILLLVMFKPRDMKILNRRIFKVFAAYILICTLSIFVAINKSEAVYGILKLCMMFIFLMISGTIIKRNKDTFVKGMAVLALILGIVSFVNLFHVKLFDCSDLARFTGSMSGKNLCAAAQALLIPFCFYSFFKHNKFWKIMAVATIILLISNQLRLVTRSVYLAVAVSLFVVLCFKPKFIPHIVIILCLAFAILGLGSVLFPQIDTYIDYTMTTASMWQRFEVWTETSKIITQRFQGVGIGNWKIHIPRFSQGIYYGLAYDHLHFVRPHNDFIGAFAETGIMGGVLYLLLFLTALGYSVYTRNVLCIAGLIGYMVFAMLSFPSERAFHSMILIIYMALSMEGLKPLRVKFKPVRNSLIMTGFILVMILGVVCFYQRWQTECYFKRIIAARKESKWQVIIDEYENYSWFSTLEYLSGPLLFYKGEAYWNLGEYKLAGLEYIKAARLHPNHLNTLNNLGTNYYLFGNFKEAERCFDRALAFWPKNEVLKQNMQRVRNLL